MTWKCPQCGVDGLEDGLFSHATEAGGCGYVKFPPGVVLVCDATGKELSIRVAATLGNALLKNLDPAEIRFVSSDQLRLEKAVDRGGWLVFNVAYATNPLYLNGAVVPPEGALLKTGDKLSIKDKYFRLTVRLLG